MKKLVVITGPTASGKTAISVQLAKALNTEIVSCDSRQFYQEMSIGTAKPSTQEMDGVKHHFIDSHSITDQINAGRFEREGLILLNHLFEKHTYVILCGGSGLFIDAITKAITDTNNDSKCCPMPPAKIQKFTILPSDFSSSTDELTPTFKLKRTIVADKYMKNILGMYEAKDAYVKFSA